VEAARLIDVIAATMREQHLTTVEQTLVRSLMLRMRVVDGYADFASVFRRRECAEWLYKHLREYSRAYMAEPPEIQAELKEKVKIAMDGVRKA